MKKTLKFSAALPLLLLVTGCSSDTPLQTEEPLEGDYTVVMTLSGGGTRAQLPLTEEIMYLRKNNLSFATYGVDGTLKHWIFQGPTDKKNTDIKAEYFTPNWGPSVSAQLPKIDYSTDFMIAAFNVPAILRPKSSAAPFAVKDLSDNDMNLIEWPGVAADKYVWSPEGYKNPDDDKLETVVPMAGLTRVTTDYMKKYNTDIYNTATTPFALPEVELTRALAKIVIVDVDGIIGQVDVKTPQYGALTPDVQGWLKGDAVLKPNVPKGVTNNMLTQTLSTPTDYVDVNGVTCAKYEFYSFEQSFYGADGRLADINDPVRDVVKLYANADSGLVGTSKETTTVTFAPYKLMAVDEEADLATADKGAWQGVMRNTVYTFYVSRPPTGGLSIVYNTEKWEKTTETFPF